MAAGKFTILGGGIAGLAASLALAKTGHPVEILEKAQKFDPVGAGIQLGPNAARALQKLGAWDAVSPITYSPPAIHLRSAVSGRLLKAIRLGDEFERRFGQPYRIAHRADLHTALLHAVGALRSIKITMGANAEAAQLSGPVIAADGVWSATREQLFPGSAARKSTVTVFRAMTEMPAIASVDFSCVNMWYHPGAHVVHYQAGVDRGLNLVAIAPGSHPLEHLQHADHKLIKILNLVPHWTQWEAAYVEPLPSWHKGNTLLIGDAAHGTFPYLAQGAAMSLEDAAALMTTTDPAGFENLRRARCARLHTQTVATGKIYHQHWPLSVFRNLTLRLSREDRLLDRMSWIYKGP